MLESAVVESRAPLRFSKMHGAGNDFVVLDLRGNLAPPAPALCRALADRHTGIGCDQILTVEDPREAGSVATYRIWNADGSSSQQCGNGARCVAAWLVRDGAACGDRFVVDSPSGRHDVERLPGGDYRIVMGVPRFHDPEVAIPGFLGAVSMGNPHALVEVDDIDDAPGPQIGERHARDGHERRKADQQTAHAASPSRGRTVTTLNMPACMCISM